MSGYLLEQFVFMVQALGSLRALNAPCREHCSSAREWKSCFAGHVRFWVSRFGCTVYSIPLNLNPKPRVSLQTPWIRDARSEAHHANQHAGRPHRSFKEVFDGVSRNSGVQVQGLGFRFRV